MSYSVGKELITTRESEWGLEGTSLVCNKIACNDNASRTFGFILSSWVTVWNCYWIYSIVRYKVYKINVPFFIVVV